MTFMCGWARDLKITNLTFENSCLVSSLSASRLSNGRSLEYVSALYIETVNYSKSVRMTFGSLSIACLWSVYVDIMHMISTPRPSRFSACNIENLGWAWVQGYMYIHICLLRICSSLLVLIHTFDWEINFAVHL